MSRKNDIFWILVAFMVLANLTVGTAAAAPILVTGCTVISVPGEYSLINDITNSPATTCIEITASNVIFEGNGHIIDGTDKPISYGIWIRGSTPITNVVVSEVTLTQWNMGLYALNARDTTIQDIHAEDNSIGIGLSETNNTLIEGNEIRNNHVEEIYLWYSSENTIRGNHITSPDTPSLALLVTQSHKNQIYNNYINNSRGVIALFSNIWNTTKTPGTNIVGGLALGGNFWANPAGNGYSETCTDSDADGFCDMPYIINANNTDRFPLKDPYSVTNCRKIVTPGTYYLKNDILNSDAIKCINITSSNVIFQGNGHTIDGQDNPSSFGIYTTSPTYSHFVVQDVIVNDWEFGISLHNTRDSAVLASSATSNRFGICPGYYNSTITNCRAVNNSQSGIYAWSNDNITIVGNTINENQFQGLYLGFSNNCSVRDNRIEGNNIGFFIVESKNTRIVNNYFNNTVNVGFGTNVSDNQWNITIRQGINIAGGPYLAGNFWANPKGDGFSQMCPDGNNDGICDTQYILDGNNTDQLPLVTFTLLPLPGYPNLPTDPDGDGLYEDLNGNGRLDFADVVLYFNQMQWIAANEPICAFDLNGNGRIDFADIVKLFEEI